MTTRKPARETAEHLLQTTVPKPLGAWVVARARADGISTASYLRRLLLRDQADSKSGDRVKEVVDHVDMLIREHTRQQGELRDAQPRTPEWDARLVALRQSLYDALCRAVRG
jgi:hypothetical protein